MPTYFKKKIAALFVVLMVMTSMFAVPSRAHAWWGILDTSFDFAAVAQSILSYAAQAAQWVKENWQRTMRDVIAKRLIDYTVDETVKWVQGGGDPKFVSDWSGFMKEAGAMAFDSVIKEAELSDICQPFAFQLRVALIPEKRFNKERVDCSISDIVANVQDFYDNFQNGGWLAYGESVKPENNLYMQLVMFNDEIKLKTNFNEDQKRQQASAGQGFLSVSTCVEDDAPQLYKECRKIGGTEDECNAYAQQSKQCTKEEVQTPGNVVGKAVGESITSDKEWAANIQSWVSALVNAAINRLTREGLAAMSGSSADADPDYDPASDEYGDLKDSELSEDQKNAIEQVEAITIPYGQLLDEKVKAKGYTEQILDLFAQLDVLDKDKICVPQTTAAEVAAQQAILSSLTGQVNELQPTVTEGSGIIEQIKDSTGSVRDTAVVVGLVSAFLDKHSATEQAEVKGKLQNLTDSATQYATLQDMQGRYSQCKEKIDLLQQQATTTPQQ